MKNHRLFIALVVLQSSSLAMALNLNVPLAKSGTTVYQYTAETAATANKQGTVLAGGLNWNCMGNRCSISGPWPTPAVASCKALATLVGSIRSYGHNQGAQLDASQLAQCNAGLSVLPAKSMVTQPLAAQPLAPAISTLPVSKTPAPGLTVPASPPGVPLPYPNADKKSPDVPANNRHSDRSVTSKDFTEITLPIPPAPGRATALPGPKSATSPATAPAPQNGFAAMPAPKGGFAAVPASPAISIPAARQLATINPALSRQLGLRAERFANLKLKVERKRTKAEADATRVKTENEKTRAAALVVARRNAERRASAAAAVDLERFCASGGDADGDGSVSSACTGGDDCDDTDAARYPGATEICDGGHDEDCNAVTFGTQDNDGDGVISSACFNTEGGSWVTRGGEDCDDSRADVSPRSVDICDHVDNNCSGRIDEGQTLPYYEDRDGDRYGSRASRMDVCPIDVTDAADQRDDDNNVPPWVANGDDCDDTNPAIYPAHGC